MWMITSWVLVVALCAVAALIALLVLGSLVLGVQGCWRRPRPSQRRRYLSASWCEALTEAV